MLLYMEDYKSHLACWKKIIFSEHAPPPTSVGESTSCVQVQVQTPFEPRGKAVPNWSKANIFKIDVW